MIIQKVIKGLGGINRSQADEMFRAGIICNWWRKIGTMPETGVYERLTARNLYWHQNRFLDPDPDDGNEPFHKHTPFISTTAGAVERDPAAGINILTPAWLVALEFATDAWQRDGYLFHCYVFVLGKQSIPHRPFSEEVRELNIYTGFSPFQPEGEVTAKINIPPTQIEKYSFYDIASVRNALAAGQLPAPSYEATNSQNYRPPEEISNIRGVLS